MYKLSHSGKMIQNIRDHQIPFPKAAFVASVFAELTGALLVGAQIGVAEGALIWLVFLLIATPIYHGAVLRAGTLDYPQFVHFLKNISIAGGLIALIVIDLGRRPSPAYLPYSFHSDGVVPVHAVNDQDISQ